MNGRRTTLSHWASSFSHNYMCSQKDHSDRCISMRVKRIYIIYVYILTYDLFSSLSLSLSLSLSFDADYVYKYIYIHICIESWTNHDCSCECSVYSHIFFGQKKILPFYSDGVIIYYDNYIYSFFTQYIYIYVYIYIHKLSTRTSGPSLEGRTNKRGISTCR